MTGPLERHDLEPASYGGLLSYADLLGEDEARDLRQQTLEEEGQADDRLTRIALRSVDAGTAEFRSTAERSGTGS